jgi:hypothetical protein
MTYEDDSILIDTMENEVAKVDLQCSYSYTICRVQAQLAFEIARE